MARFRNEVYYSGINEEAAKKCTSKEGIAWPNSLEGKYLESNGCFLCGDEIVNVEIKSI